LNDPISFEGGPWLAVAAADLQVLQVQKFVGALSLLFHIIAEAFPHGMHNAAENLIDRHGRCHSD